MTPEKEELKDWLEKDITKWFFNEMLEQFDANNKVLYADVNENIGVYKGQQQVMRYFRNPGDLL